MAINKNKVLANAQKYAQKGAYEKAIAEYMKVVKEEPEDVRAWLKIGDLYAKKGSRKEATATYLKVAEYYAGQGFYLKAVAVYKQILKLDPTVVSVNLRLAELYQQLGLLSDAQSQYEIVSAYYQRSGQVREALDVMQKLVDLDPDNVPSRIKLAELYSKADLRADAVREFGVAADRLREQGRVDDFVKVAERLLWHKADEMMLTRELASIYLERGDTKRALAKLQQCFQADSTDVDTLSLLATAFQTVGQVAKTISVYREMARIFGESGDDFRCRDVLESILALAPDDPEARQQLYGNEAPPVAAGVTDPMAEPGEQLTDDVVSMELDPAAGGQDVLANEPIYDSPAQQPIDQMVGYDQPQDPYAQSSEPYEAGDEAYDAGDFGDYDEIQEFDEIDEIEEIDEVDELEDVIVVENAQSNEEEILRLLTETDVFVKYGLYDKAIEHLQKIFEIEPIHIEAREKLKDLYIQMGDLDQAVLELFYLSDLYADSDAETAIYYLQQLLQISPDHPDAVERMRRLGVDIGPSNPSSYPSPDSGAHNEASDLFFSVDDELVGEQYGSSVGSNPAAQSYEPDEAATSAELSQPTHEEMTFETTTEENLSPRPKPVLSAAALEEELEEVEFFIQQGLDDEARDLLHELGQAFPGNLLVIEKLNELDGDDAGAELLDQSFDLGSQIPGELEQQPDGAEADQDNGGGVKDVFEQFKQGVAKQVDAGDADTHYDLGVAYKEMGLVEDAVAEFEIARENPEREAIAQTMIGNCYSQNSQYTEAINAYKRGLYAEQKTDSEELELYYALGNTYLLLSDPREALYYFQKIAKREPEFRDVQEQIATIKADGTTSDS